MSFTCPICNMTSYNKNDEINRYCGNCHVFIDDVIFQFGIDKLDKLIKDKSTLSSTASEQRERAGLRGPGVITTERG